MTVLDVYEHTQALGDLHPLKHMENAKPRPKSAAICCGVSARPAGVSGFLGDAGQKATIFRPSKAVTLNGTHALRLESPYAEVMPKGWYPREPPVQPMWSHHGAGSISRGCVDNTYMPQPLQNAWGKSRDMSRRERRKPPHKQCTDLIVTCKGYALPGPPVKLSQFSSVLEPYAQTIPVAHPLDAQRIESGFVRGPNKFPGAMPTPKSPLTGTPPPFDCSSVPDAFQRKKTYEKSWVDTSVIPVQKSVRDGRKRPATAQPHFMRKFAGLPGGLGLIN